MTQLQTVEPRYVIECFPVIVALGALVWAMPGRRSAATSGAAHTLPVGLYERLGCGGKLTERSFAALMMTTKNRAGGDAGAT